MNFENSFEVTVIYLLKTTYKCNHVTIYKSKVDSLALTAIAKILHVYFLKFSRKVVPKVFIFLALVSFMYYMHPTISLFFNIVENNRNIISDALHIEKHKILVY